MHARCCKCQCTSTSTSGHWHIVIRLHVSVSSRQQHCSCCLCKCSSSQPLLLQIRNYGKHLPQPFCIAICGNIQPAAGAIKLDVSDRVAGAAAVDDAGSPHWLLSAPPQLIRVPIRHGRQDRQVPHPAPVAATQTAPTIRKPRSGGETSLY